MAPDPAAGRAFFGQLTRVACCQIELGGGFAINLDIPEPDPNSFGDGTPGEASCAISETLEGRGPRDSSNNVSMIRARSTGQRQFQRAPLPHSKDQHHQHRGAHWRPPIPPGPSEGPSCLHRSDLRDAGSWLVRATTMSEVLSESMATRNKVGPFGSFGSSQVLLFGPIVACLVSQWSMVHPESSCSVLLQP